MVNREPEWDDRARDEAEALYLLPAKTCPCGCGQDFDLTRSATQGWDVDTEVCQAGRALAIAQRQFADRHENAKPDRAGALPDDGVIWHIRPHEPKG